MKKNILFIIESSETGGAENVFAELVQRIDRERYVPHVALLYEGWLFDRLSVQGINPHLIPNRNGGFDYRMLKGIGMLVKQCKIDLIHSHLFTTNVYASVSGAFAGIPVISTFHGIMDVDAKDRFNWIKWQAINRLSRKIVFVSYYLKNYFVTSKMVNEAKGHVIYNGIDIKRFNNQVTKAVIRSNLGLSETSFIIGCVGDLRPAKDYESAVKAASLLKQSIPGIKLVIAGTESDLKYELEALGHRLGIGNDIHFIGFRPDIENVFPAFDVYLSSSLSEGFSLTVVEAMAAGLPVVATRSGGPSEIISNGETGLLVGVSSPEEIVNAIIAIYQTPTFAADLIQAGLRMVETTFSVQSMVDHYQLLYNELLH